MQYLIGKWILGSAPLEMKYLVDLYLFFHFAFNGFTAFYYYYCLTLTDLSSVFYQLRRLSTQRRAATHRNNDTQGFVLRRQSECWIDIQKMIQRHSGGRIEIQNVG